MLEVTGLAKAFGEREVFRDVTFVVAKGETVAITGESGAGKSVLAWCIAGIMRPTSGRVAFHGGRGSMQMLFQDSDSSLNPRMNVREILEEPLRILGLPRTPKRIGELLDSVSLPASVLDRYPSELSGGQRQRVAIARALAPEPLLLIADEPAASLDPSLQAEMFFLLQQLRSVRELSLLLIFHNIEAVGLMTSRVLRMAGGRLISAPLPGS
jgi:peptide/nickel transport system ATP-binding protein